MSVELPNLEACPSCGYVMELTTGVCGARVPADGDVSVCLNCGHLSLFDARKALRDPTPEELADLRQSDAWPTIRRAQMIIAARGPIPRPGKERL